MWGYNGYCRLGLGNQQDVLIPKPVPQVRPPLYSLSSFRLILLQFAGPNEMTMGSDIAAGPSNSVVIDKQGMYWMAGKASVVFLRVPRSNTDIGAVEKQW